MRRKLDIMWSLVLLVFTFVSVNGTRSSDLEVVNECLINNGGCSQKCVDDVIGFHCECHAGYQLYDNLSCKDIDECQIPGSCSQLFDNTTGSFKCSCLEGYSTELSNHVCCKAESGHGALLFCNRTDLLMKDLETSEYRLIASSLTGAAAIDYDYEKKLVVWTDDLEESIYSTSLQNGTSVVNTYNDSAINTVVKVRMIYPDSLAVDWIHGNVYWIDARIIPQISVASMDGKFIKLLFGTHFSTLQAIVVNPLEGWLFWADWGSPSKIERAGMDGTHRSVIVSENIAWPKGLTIDFLSKKLFWADTELSILCSSDYDGSNVKVVLSSSTKVKHPFSLDVFEDWLYWTNYYSEGTYKVDKFSGRNLQTVTSGFYYPRLQFKVYHSSKQPKGRNYCGQTNGNCSHLCLPAPQITPGSAKFTCACPNGMVLTDNKQNCLMIDAVTARPTFTPTTYVTTRRSTTTTVKVNPHILKDDTVQPQTYSTIRRTHIYVPTTRPLYYPTTARTRPSTAEISTTTEESTSYMPVYSQTVPRNYFMNETLREIQEESDDSGKIAGIIIGVLGGLTIVISVVGFCIYKQYLRRNITSMNFDNPVYQKQLETSLA